MKSKFTDFIAEYPNCAKFADDSEASAVFDILSKEDNIIKMVDATETGIPALSACIKEVEAFFDSIKNPTFDLKEHFPRTAVGKMVKVILAPLGYEPTVSKYMPISLNLKYFSSATCYKKTGIAIMHIVRRVEDI